MIKGSIFQEDITVLNMYLHYSRTSNYETLKLIVIQGKIGESIIIFGDIHSSLLEMDRSSREKISKNIVELSNTIS